MATLDELIAEFQRAFTDPFQEAPPQVFNVGPEGSSPPSGFEQFLSVPDQQPVQGPQFEPGSTDRFASERALASLGLLQDRSQGAAPEDIFSVIGDEAIRGRAGGGFTEFDLESTPFANTPGGGQAANELLAKMADNSLTREDVVRLSRELQVSPRLTEQADIITAITDKGLNRSNIQSQIGSRGIADTATQTASELARNKDVRETERNKVEIESIFNDIASGKVTLAQGQERLNIQQRQQDETERSAKVAEDLERRKQGFTEKQTNIENKFSEAKIALMEAGVAGEDADRILKKEKLKLEKIDSDREGELLPFRKEASKASTDVDTARVGVLEQEAQAAKVESLQDILKSDKVGIADKIGAVQQLGELRKLETKLPSLPEDEPFGTISFKNIFLPGEITGLDFGARKKNREDEESITQLSKILGVRESELLKLIGAGDPRSLRIKHLLEEAAK